MEPDFYSDVNIGQEFQETDSNYDYDNYYDDLAEGYAFESSYDF